MKDDQSIDYVWDHSGKSQSDRFSGHLKTMTSLESIQAIKKDMLERLCVRQGDRVLDVGCGQGDDVLAIADKVGTSGLVVGLDHNKAMIDEANTKKEWQGEHIKMEFGDIHKIPYEDGFFDSCRADRVLQHVNDQEQVLREMVRVIKPGGHLVVSDPDWDTRIIDVPCIDLVRKILPILSKSVRNHCSGRQHYGQLKRLLLDDVSISSWTTVITDSQLALKILGIDSGFKTMIKANLLEVEEVENLKLEILRQQENGQFFAAVTSFTVSGTKVLRER